MDQGQHQRCHAMCKKFPYWPTHDVFLLSGHISEVCLGFSESHFVTYVVTISEH
jgi:hypothetical protein